MPALTFGEQLLPPVPIFGVRGVSILLLQRGYVRRTLPVPGVDASRGGVEIPPHTVQPRRLEHMHVDQHVVVHNLGLVRLDEPDPAHVRGEIVDLRDTVRGPHAVLPAPQVEQLEFVGGTGLVLGRLEVHAAHPAALCNEALHEVMSDESASTGNQHTLYAHVFLRHAAARRRTASAASGPYTTSRSNRARA